jgi:CpcD/allophycocyanin linker domain
MAITSITSNIGNISSYDSRMVSITFTGRQQTLHHQIHQTQSMPYNRLSQAMQKIRRHGGVITAVFMHAVSANQVAKPTKIVAGDEPATDQVRDQGSSKKKKR